MAKEYLPQTTIHFRYLGRKFIAIVYKDVLTLKFITKPRGKRLYHTTHTIVGTDTVHEVWDRHTIKYIIDRTKPYAQRMITAYKHYLELGKRKRKQAS